MFPLRRCASTSDIEGGSRSFLQAQANQAAVDIERSEPDPLPFTGNGHHQFVEEYVHHHTDHLAESHAPAGSRYMRSKISQNPDDVDAERRIACTLLVEAQALRCKYLRFSSGDFEGDIPSLAEFAADYNRLLVIEANGPLRTFAHSRISVLQSAFDMHFTMNREFSRDASLTDKSVFFGTDARCCPPPFSST